MSALTAKATDLLSQVVTKLKDVLQRFAHSPVSEMSIAKALDPHVTRELSAAATAQQSADLATAWLHLERAHILSQPAAWLHTRVHLAMLALAIRQVDVREIFGQLLRAAVAGIGSMTGRFPLGNTGRARVPIMKPMPIADDLARLLEDAKGDGFGGRRER
jgi:hypothetical protein